MSKTQWTDEIIFEKFNAITQKGLKLTKKNLDDENPELYDKSVEMFGSWMNAKRAYYTYIEQMSDPTRNLHRLLIVKIQELEKIMNIAISENDKLNPAFVKNIEKTDITTAKIILNEFGTWEKLYMVYSEHVADEIESITDKQVASDLMDVLKSEAKIDEAAISKKYADMYNIITKKYGSFKDAIVHFLEGTIKTA